MASSYIIVLVSGYPATLTGKLIACTPPAERS